MVHVGKTGGGSLAQYFLSSRFRSCTTSFCWCTTPEELAAAIEEKGAEVRRLKEEEGLGNKDPQVQERWRRF